MPKAKSDGNGSLEAAADPVENAQAEANEALDEGIEDRSDMVATVATVAVVGVAAVVFEAALLPGIVLGVAAVAVPRYFPRIGGALNPHFRSTVRGAYKLGHKTREMMAEAQEQELRWHLAVMVPRLPLTRKEKEIAIRALKSYLEDSSSIVKTLALQGLADLAQDDPNLRSGVVEILRQATRNGTPAMKARSRNLLIQLEDDLSSR